MVKDKEIYYCVDIDALGFETLNKFDLFSVEGNKTFLSELKYLNDNEKEIYAFVVESNKSCTRATFDVSLVK